MVASTYLAKAVSLFCFFNVCARAFSTASYKGHYVHGLGNRDRTNAIHVGHMTGLQPSLIASTNPLALNIPLNHINYERDKDKLTCINTSTPDQPFG